jgi:fatty acid desaturase
VGVSPERTPDRRWTNVRRWSKGILLDLANFDRNIEPGLAVSMGVGFEDHDYSRKFQALRPIIVDSRGLKYVDFLKSLKADYVRVYRDIAAGYIALVISAVVAALLPNAITLVTLLVALASAVSIGFWIAYLQLFIHEGAHHNLAADRTKSDLVCNLSVAWIVGTSVQQYRIVHFQHHRALGKVDDSEFTYFSPLNPVFILKSLFGVRVAEVLRARKGVAKTARSANAGKYFGLFGVLVHAVIVVASFLTGHLWLTTAWIVGVVMFFPLFGSLRQLLEHRDPKADPKVDFSGSDHGAYTRIFGAGIFSSIFGGAGFNRHLLHHWEPQVSYTNLSQMESYLLDTQVADLIERRRSSYFGTFTSLFTLS